MANSVISAPLQIHEITVYPENKTTDIHIPYPDGFNASNTMIVDIATLLYQQWYTQADVRFNILTSLTGSYINLGLSGIDDRIIGKPVKIMIIHV